MRYDGPTGPLEHPAPAPGTGGRHRRGGPVRRRAVRRPSFRAVVLAAGTAAAALTVVTGWYAASPHRAPAPPPAAASLPTAPPPARPPTALGPRPAQAEPPAPADRLRGAAPDSASAAGSGSGSDGGLEPQTGQARAAAATVPARAAQYVRDVVELANAEREKAGCGALRSEARLRKAAQGHADDMAARDYYAHDSPEGRDGGDRLTAAGYGWSAWAENIHRGPKTPERAMDAWMDSPAHRANILDCSFRDIGVGVALTADGPWWVQNFGVRG